MEYLVIAAIIAAAVLMLKPTLTTNVNNLYNNAGNKVAGAATALGGLNTE